MGTGGSDERSRLVPCVGPTTTEVTTLDAGVHLYGLVTPIPCVYDPSGESSWMTGSQTGDVMGLWGTLWVAP